MNAVVGRFLVDAYRRGDEFKIQLDYRAPILAPSRRAPSPCGRSVPGLELRMIRSRWESGATVTSDGRAEPH